VVWWPRLDVGSAKKELNEIQRLVCICVTGAMKSTATTAIEALINLPPVQAELQAKAFATADRLSQNGLWTPNFTSGHGKIKDVITDEVFAMPRDRMRPETDFVRRFEAVIPSRSEWLEGWPSRVSSEGIVSFTDGSETSGGAGAGVFSPGCGVEMWYHLGRFANVNQAETFAALKGVQEAIPTEACGKNVTVCSDSEALIRALVSPVVTSRLMKELRETLNRAGLKNQVRLVWVPGHSGVEGNEKADELARKGSAALSCGPEPIIPIPHSACVNAIRCWVRTEFVNHWSAYEGGVHTKRFFLVPDGRWARELLNMDRCRIRRVVGAITGHCGLNKHLAKMGLSNDPNCSCGLGEETGVHIICECPKFSALRLRTLGGHVVQPTTVTRTCSS